MVGEVARLPRSRACPSHEEESGPTVEIFPCAFGFRAHRLRSPARCTMRTEVIEDENDDGVKEERKRRRKAEEGEV